MNKITDLLDRVKKFNDALTSGRLMQDIVMENEAYICDVNSQEQLYEKGINRLGVDIMDYMPYTDFTISIKEEKGQPTNRVTLKDEGDFYRSFYIEADLEKFEIKARDEKTEDLVKKYGDILGLTNENKFMVAWEYIYPDLLTEAKKTIL